ncbi:unnamed protein product [Discosporangium mesarthrocarpum]
MGLIRLILLEGRILFFSRSGATVSEAVLAVASLLPGSLALGVGQDPSGFDLFGLKSYRWSKFGFPLKVFSEDIALEPYMVIAGAPKVLAKRGFFAGTTNGMIKSLPDAQLDLLVDVDTWTLEVGKTPLAKASFDLGEDERAFIRVRVRVSGGDKEWDSDGDREWNDCQWEGSSGWVVDMFQVYFEDLVGTAARCIRRNLELQQTREADEKSRVTRENSLRRGSALNVLVSLGEGIGLDSALQSTSAWLSGAGVAVPLSAALEDHGRRWAEAWAGTENFSHWAKSNKITRADTCSPRPRYSPYFSSPSSNQAPLVVAGGGAGRGGGSRGSGSGRTNTGLGRGGNHSPRSGVQHPDPDAVGGSDERRGFRGTGPGVAPPRSGMGEWRYSSGDRYTGGWKDSKRHGVGVYEERATGNVYEGDWVSDLRHGRGVMTSGGKDFLYDGEWKEDKRTGRGNCVIRGRETYSGEWLAGEFHGKGVYCDKEGNVYDGEHVRGRREGAGKYTSITKETYVGEWKDGQRWGLGQCTYPDGTVYSGEWRAGQFSGEGTLVQANGERYEGMFQAGLKHGVGSLTTPEGDILEGEWDKSRPMEDGVEWRIRFANGNHYLGQCAGGSPHGQGTCKYANGDVFTGGWVEGLRSGIGICVFANGERFEGDWSEDNISFQGKGELTLADGTTHDFT